MEMLAGKGNETTLSHLFSKMFLYCMLYNSNTVVCQAVKPLILNILTYYKALEGEGVVFEVVKVLRSLNTALDKRRMECMQYEV